MSATHFICPGCGAEIRVGSKGCPKCTRQPSAAEKPAPKPWEQDEIHDGLDLIEDDDFDYDSFIADEFGAPKIPYGKALLWWITAIILLVALFYMLVR